MVEGTEEWTESDHINQLEGCGDEAETNKIIVRDATGNALDLY